ncbi:SDR family NAD(P)-dependent oxidoreductase [Streptomyces sp. NBC_01525]|uniref:SDR family NAD(P)-dependent oxidoreductase n=1 Tax=Streptomyces sp. NBC_01525 TaxID=2903893 RepID=UPI00386334D8
MLVTGAGSGIGSGIGWASSLRLVRAGYEVFAAVRTPQEAALLMREAGVDGVARLRAFPLDVTDAEACAVAVAEVGERTGGGPWGLVNADAAVVARAVEETGSTWSACTSRPCPSSAPSASGWTSRRT